MGWLSRLKKPVDDGTTPEQGTGSAAPAAPPVPVAPAGTLPGDPDPARPETATAASAPPPAPPSAPEAAPSAAPPFPAMPPAEVLPTAAPVTGALPEGTQPVSPMGRYGPQVSVTRLDVAPPELGWQLPLNGELFRLIPGSDRPDYSLMVLERPLHFYPPQGFDLRRVEADQRVEDRKGRQMVRVHALLLCARFVGQQLHPGMVDLPVNLAYVVDSSLAQDERVDFAKIEFAAVGFLSEGHAERAADSRAAAPPPAVTEPAPAPDGAAEAADGAAPAPQPAEPVDGGLEGALVAVGHALRRGVEQQRGGAVTRMTASLTLDDEQRLTGLSGNADGAAPVPTEATFAELSGLLAALPRVPGGAAVRSVTVRVEGDAVTAEPGQ